MGFFSKKSRGWALHIWSTVVVCTYCSSGFAVIWASSLEISLQDLWGRTGSKFCLLIFLSLVIETAWLGYLFGLDSADWVWRVKWVFPSGRLDPLCWFIWHSSSRIWFHHTSNFNTIQEASRCENSSIVCKQMRHEIF